MLEENALIAVPRFGALLGRGGRWARFLCGSLLVSSALAQSAAAPGSFVATPAQAGKPAFAAAPTRYRTNRFPRRAVLYYGQVWGVDSLTVRTAESGEMVRFTYRVVDADKARMLNDKKSEPSLIAPKAHVRLVVPQMEKIGQLRQTATPEAGKTYWMAFSNKGRLVKPGDRVDIVVGKFRASGLLVEGPDTARRK